MIINLLFQTFLFSLMQNPQEAVDIPPESIEVSAAYEEDVLVEGFDEQTAMSFSHTLPAVREDSFGPQRIESESLGVLTTAESALVIDKRSWKVLFNKSAEEVRPIASITKLMTALTLLDLNIDLSQQITISPQDHRDGGRINVYSGEKFVLQDLWMAGLIASDNVAITALVRSSGLTQEEFVMRMNELAKELGLKNSHFVEPTGINRANVSTAMEVATLLNAAMEHPIVSDAVRRPVYSFKPLNKDTTRTVKATNILLNSFVNEDPYRILGGKTGFTFEAGYCLGLGVDGPGDTDDLIVVVLGADSPTARFQEVKGLVDWTYENFKWN